MDSYVVCFALGEIGACGRRTVVGISAEPSHSVVALASRLACCGFEMVT